MWKEFKEFALKGSLVELAVAFILGAAFGLVVQSLVRDVITPVIGAVFGEPDFSGLTFKVGDGVIRYGSFLNTLLAFLLVAFVLFLIVKAVNRMQKRPDVEADARTCPECLESIPEAARRCKYCTTELAPA